MNMTIKALEVNHFKGIAHVLLELDGRNAVISGRNGTGKTSVCDAYLWMLFGKDSAGNKPDVKPRNSLGERVEGMESEVRATLTVDGKDITLRRQWHEVWSKDAESGAKVYSRDETLCWIDDVPVKLEKEYDPYVRGITGGEENQFRLLSDLGAFMRMSIAERRKELIRIAGGDPDAELQSKPEYADIPAVLRGAIPEDAKKRLLEQRRALETELKTLPARIDELERMKRPITDADIKASEDALAALQAEADGIEAEMQMTTEALERTNGLYARKRTLETRRAEIERNLRKPIEEALSTAEGKLHTIRRTVAALESDRLVAEGDLRKQEIYLAKLGDQRTAKLTEWHNFDELLYIAPDIDTVCPTCGQLLPGDQVKGALEKHREGWEAKRLASMEAIKSEGRKVAEQMTATTATIDRLKAEMAACDEKLAHAADGAPELEAEIERLQKAVPLAEDNADWKAVMADLEAVDAQLSEQGKDTHRDALTARKTAIRQEMKTHTDTLNLRNLNRDIQARIDVLTEDKRKVGAQIAAVEGQIDLLARYVRARCGLLEESINRQFRRIRWKLFDFAKNGSLIDCCDATVDGIAYGLSSLNTGACVNADIEIIRVLGEAYGVTVPCFVDNAERVNTLGFPGGQRILLRVTDDNDLTIMKEE